MPHIGIGGRGCTVQQTGVIFKISYFVIQWTCFYFLVIIHLNANEYFLSTFINTFANIFVSIHF